MSKWGEQNEKLLRLVGLVTVGEGRLGWGKWRAPPETHQRLCGRRENGSGHVGI